VERNWTRDERNCIHHKLLAFARSINNQISSVAGPAASYVELNPSRASFGRSCLKLAALRATRIIDLRADQRDRIFSRGREETKSRQAEETWRDATASSRRSYNDLKIPSASLSSCLSPLLESRVHFGPPSRLPSPSA